VKKHVELVELGTNIIKSYHTALAKEIIVIKHNKFQDKFINYDSGMSEPAKK
jgi:hypothetical protein